MYFLFQQLLPKLRGDFFEPSSIFFLKFPVPNNLQSKKMDILASKQLKSQKALQVASQDAIDYLVHSLNIKKPEDQIYSNGGQNLGGGRSNFDPGVGQNLTPQKKDLTKERKEKLTKKESGDESPGVCDSSFLFLSSSSSRLLFSAKV